MPEQHANGHYADAPDDAMSDYSTRKPLNTFDTLEEDDGFLEDGLSIPRRRRRSSRGSRRRTSWWRNMVVRARRKISMDDLKNGLDEALLQDSFASRRTRRKRTWYNYCIFGGISGLTIL